MTTALKPATPPAAPAASPPSGPQPFHVTIDHYHRMVAADVFTRRDHVFLWKGRLVQKMTKKPPHIIVQAELTPILVRLVPAGWYVSQEQPIVLDDDSEPEPDFSIVRGASRDYADRVATARDVALVIEVADSSLRVDSTETLAAYARNAIPVYWLVNIPDRRLEVYRRPEGGRYAEQQVFGPDDEAPLVLDGQEVGRVAVRAILP